MKLTPLCLLQSQGKHFCDHCCWGGLEKKTPPPEHFRRGYFLVGEGCGYISVLVGKGRRVNKKEVIPKSISDLQSLG